MKKTIYLIFRYVDGEALNPIKYDTLELAEKAFAQLGRELKERANNPDGIDEWDEIGGKEIACMSEDTIYRLVAMEVSDDIENLCAYMEYEDDKYHQISHIEVSHIGECRRQLKGFIEEWGRADGFDLVDGGMYQAKFETEGKEQIHEAYVLSIDEGKTEFEVNVHYNFVARIKVKASTEAEALKAARIVADELPQDQLEFVDFIDAYIK